ncbi:MAG: insulinase family protein, partial [Gammaproteobacteria bacterium]|nr:insulinase family protein [Gammaproteobacteria bacterium]
MIRISQLTMVCAALLLSGVVFAQNVTLPDAERLVLENGTVLILNEKHDVPLIGLEAIALGGAVADSKHGTASLLAELLEKGAGERGSAEFAEAIAAVGGELSTSAGVESVSVSAEFMAKDAALMVELVADLLQRPALKRDEFEKLRDRSVNIIKAAKGSDPGNLMPSYANAFLFGEHPYGNPVGGSETSLAAISHGDLLAYYNDVLGGDRLIVSVSGAFETAKMRELLTAAFSGWRAAAAALPVISSPSRADGNRVFLIDKPGATQTYFRIGNIGVARSFSGRADLDLANTVFGGRFTSMLMTELRVKSGLSYSARSAMARYSQPGSAFISSFTETSTTVEALDVALGTLAQLRDSGLDAEMITSARNYVMGQFPPRLETAAQLAGQFAVLEAYGLDASYINNYGDDLAAVTPESIAAVIDRVYPKSDALVFVILGDADIIREQLAQFGPITEIALSAP